MYCRYENLILFNENMSGRYDSFRIIVKLVQNGSTRNEFCGAHVQFLEMQNNVMFYEKEWIRISFPSCFMKFKEGSEGVIRECVNVFLFLQKSTITYSSSPTPINFQL